MRSESLITASALEGSAFSPTPSASAPTRWLESHRRVELRRADLTAPPPGVGAFGLPVRDLDGLLRRLPDRARRGGSQRRGRVPERRMGATPGAGARGALRAGRPAGRGHVLAPRDTDLVHVLALAVRGRRHHAALGVLPSITSGSPASATGSSPRTWSASSATSSCRRRRLACSRSGASSTPSRSTRP